VIRIEGGLLERNPLKKGSILPAGFERQCLKLRGDVARGDFVAAFAGATAFEQVVGQKCHVGTERLFAQLMHRVLYVQGKGGRSGLRASQRAEKQQRKDGHSRHATSSGRAGVQALAGDNKLAK